MFHVIVNPAGASGNTLKTWKRMEKLFADVDYQVHFSEEKNGIYKIARELTEFPGKKDIILFGGDGSMNELINGIRDLSEVRVGLVPCGSGNDFAKDLNLPTFQEQIVEEILKGKTRRTIDVGKLIINDQSETVDRLFNISTGIGYDAAICEEVERSTIKKYLNMIGLGQLAYIVIAIGLIFKTPRVRLELATESGSIVYPKTLFSVIMNHRYEGGGFMFCPDACDSDGILDYAIGGNLSTFDFFRIFPYAYKGNHVKFKEVFIGKSRSIHLSFDQPCWIHTDGEVLCRTSDVTVVLHDSKLSLLM